MVDQGLVETRNRAQQLIAAGSVLVNGTICEKNARRITTTDEVTIAGRGLRFVGRGGEKLAFALKRFNVDIYNKTCADIGSSTGGFTDCLLQNGAKKIYAIDVGKDQLVKRLKEDPRVVSLEGTDIRTMDPLPEQMDIIAIDVSFISLKLILPSIERLLSKGGIVMTLIKPQFEGGKNAVDKHGVIKDEELRISIVEDLEAWMRKNGWEMVGREESPVVGGKGNIEYLACLRHA